MSETTDSPTASGAETEAAVNTPGPDDGAMETPASERQAAEPQAAESQAAETRAAETPRPGSAGDTPAAASAGADVDERKNELAELEQEGEYAADYLEGLLDILDLDGDLDLDVEGGRAAVAIVGSGLDALVGEDGATLEALQDLTRLAVQQRAGTRSRLMLDVAGHRARRRVQLSELGTSAARRVLESGKVERLSPMSPFERKVVHDAVAGVDGVHSESEGEEPQRRVVVLPD